MKLPSKVAAESVQVGKVYRIRGQSPVTGERYDEGAAVVLDVQPATTAFDMAAAALLGAALCRVRFLADGSGSTDGADDVGMRYVLATDLVEGGGA